MKVKAAVVYELNKGFVIEELDLEPPRKEEVLVEVKVAGICHSDWNFVTGDSIFNMPVVLGHEGSGVVLEAGPGSKYRKGDRVVFNSAPNCGTCFDCTHDKPSICGTYTGPTWEGIMFELFMLTGSRVDLRKQREGEQPLSKALREGAPLPRTEKRCRCTRGGPLHTSPYIPLSHGNANGNLIGPRMTWLGQALVTRSCHPNIDSPI